METKENQTFPQRDGSTVQPGLDAPAVRAGGFHSKPMKEGKKWTVEIWIAQPWIEDGFDLKPELLEEAINAELLPYANLSEIRVTLKGGAQ